MGYASVNGAMPDSLGDLTGLQLLDSKASPNISIDAVQISSVGKVTALYSNGTEKLVGQIALTSFKETSRLQSVGAAQYVKTDRSGPPVTGLSGTNSTGSMLAGSIEGSNVDISEELIDLITAQRNYQAAAKVLETSSEIAEVVRHIKV
jgi:flagellar hook protein FlgE